ncbi:helix-turn-helix transcriptional regulator [Methylomonas sp. AM2-LC]|uniref:helix-turn-helix transcriptional regulator n=1 Tax=Methylomonas sp. AM2-LC TaxID=3153301 RepID=UPI003266AAC7
MIKNERQLKITGNTLRKFESILVQLTTQYQSSADLKLKMQIDALETDVLKLKREIEEFEYLKSGAVKIILAKSFHDLPNVIIKARIARALTQKDLALKLGMKEQQIQRYETNDFASASFAMMVKIVDALDITIEEKVRLNKI